jgi:hypothetical protein
VAVEFNVTAEHKFFLGEDKVIDLTIFGQDGVTPLDVSGLPLEWSLKKTDKASDPGILEKSITALGVSVPAASGITIVGTYNVLPASNTQRVRLTFAAAETNPALTALLATPYKLKPDPQEYRHSLKRSDMGNRGMLTHGSFVFLQATESI